MHVLSDLQECSEFRNCMSYVSYHHYWVFHVLLAREYDMVSQKAESRIQLDTYMHIQIHREASARIHKYLEQYITAE